MRLRWIQTFDFGRYGFQMLARILLSLKSGFRGLPEQTLRIGVESLIAVHLYCFFIGVVLVLGVLNSDLYFLLLGFLAGPAVLTFVLIFLWNAPFSDQGRET